MDKIYHIYAKDRCLYHNLPKEKFEETWTTLNNILSLVHCEYEKDDLSYEELHVDRKLFENPSY
jgi:hypothetical protein